MSRIQLPICLVYFACISGMSGCVAVYEENKGRRWFILSKIIQFGRDASGNQTQKLIQCGVFKNKSDFFRSIVLVNSIRFLIDCFQELKYFGKVQLFFPPQRNKYEIRQCRQSNVLVQKVTMNPIGRIRSIIIGNITNRKCQSQMFNGKTN